MSPRIWKLIALPIPVPPTVADARLGTVSSSKLSGALPALDGSALTNLNIPAGFNELDAALFN